MKTGIDVVDNSRFTRVINRDGRRICRRLFTPEELAGKPDETDLARMFSAKEAIAKALGTGFDSSLSWHDISVFADGHSLVAVLSGRALELAGGRKVLLSSSTGTGNAVFTLALLI